MRIKINSTTDVDRRVKEVNKESWLIYFLFSFFLRPLKAEWVKATNDLKKKLEDKEKWMSVCEIEHLDEETIHSMKISIEKDRKILTVLKDKIRSLETPLDEKKIAEEQKISLEAKMDAEACALKVKTDKFDKEHVSGIDIAEYVSLFYKKEAQMKAVGKMCVAWTVLFVSIFMISLIVGLAYYFFSPFEFCKKTISLILVLIIFAPIVRRVVLKSYRTVPEKEEWLMQWFGKYLTTWEPGLRFRFPFFMNRGARVTLKTFSIPLFRGDEKNTKDKAGAEGRKDADVEFSDTSAGVDADLFIRIVDSFLSVYAVDHMVSSVRKNMETGIRAYYGGEDLDSAIEGKVDVSLRSIITENATDASNFKDWGVRVVSLAIGDFILSPELDAQRQLMYSAENKLKRAAVEIQTEEKEVIKKKLQGQGDGEKLKQFAESFGVPVKDALAYILQTKKYDAYEKAGILIAGNSMGTSMDSALSGAVAGAAAQAGLNVKSAKDKNTETPIEEKVVEKKDDNQKKKKQK